ncbi:MAG: nuclear transport factor 2 family protein, partial [Candidatus Binatia bacterium]
MSVEENIKTAEEHLEAEANRELDRLLGTLVEDCVYEESLLEKPVQGKKEIAEYYHELWRGFPDFTYIVTNRVADESCVIYEMTFRGTHTGTFRG